MPAKEINILFIILSKHTANFNVSGSFGLFNFQDRAIVHIGGRTGSSPVQATPKPPFSKEVLYLLLRS